MITPGELSIGTLVTIERWVEIIHSIDRESYDNFSSGTATATTVTSCDTPWRGDVFEVVSIQLPFVVLHHHGRCQFDQFNRGFDTQKIRLMDISEEYAKAILEIDNCSPFPYHTSNKS